MSRPPLPPGSRKSRLRDDGDFDNIVGAWSVKRRVEMDRKFCEAMRREIGETASAELDPMRGMTTRQDI